MFPKPAPCPQSRRQKAKQNHGGVVSFGGNAETRIGAIVLFGAERTDDDEFRAGTYLVSFHLGWNGERVIVLTREV